MLRSRQVVDVMHLAVAIHGGPATALVASNPATSSAIRNHTTCSPNPGRISEPLAVDCLAARKCQGLGTRMARCVIRLERRHCAGSARQDHRSKVSIGAPKPRIRHRGGIKDPTVSQNVTPATKIRLRCIRKANSIAFRWDRYCATAGSATRPCLKMSHCGTRISLVKTKDHF